MCTCHFSSPRFFPHSEIIRWRFCHVRKFQPFFEPEDFDLARRVKLFLASQPRPALRYLQVEARGAAVTLRGLVCTFYERQLALQCSRRVAGVRELIDEVMVQDIAPQPPVDLSRAGSRSEENLAVAVRA